MNYYRGELINSLREYLENFISAGFLDEAEIIKRRIEALTVNKDEPLVQEIARSPVIEKNVNIVKEQIRKNIHSEYLKLTNFEIDTFDEEIEKATTLKALYELRGEIIENTLKIHRTKKSKKSMPQIAATNATGHYNNSKTFINAIALIENQDSFWLENLKETYMPIVAAASSG